MNTTPPLPRQTGVSLIEALVALAVMAFGMLGMVGIQSSLRANSDAARQRSEAVRIAQESIERARSYTIVTAVATPDPNRVYYDALATTPATTVTGYTTNTTYTRAVTVTPAAQGFKTIVVNVTWPDRSGTTQQVRLTTIVHRSPLELAGALGIRGTGTNTESPFGSDNKSSIPRGAVDQGDGTSRYTPSAAGGTTALVFSHDTGLITRVCDLVTSICTSVTARLVSGFINFATGASAPGATQAEVPPGTAVAVGVTVNQTLPSSGVPAPQCFVETPSASPSLAYACLVHVSPPTTPFWSGQVRLTGLTLAGTVSDASAAAFRVCRYTPFRSNAAVGTTVPGVTPAVTMQNFHHPLEYSSVNRNFLDHNFLVIRAGDGTTAFGCPADDAVSTPFVNTNTFDHQPSS